MSEFETKKEQLLKENQEKYGEELNQYDSNFVAESNQKFKKMSQFEMNRLNALAEEIHAAIKVAMPKGAESEEAMRACELHKEWISGYWPSYSSEMHLGVVQMYTVDERFKEYYDKHTLGAAEFLYESMKHFVNKAKD